MSSHVCPDGRERAASLWTHTSRTGTISQSGHILSMAGRTGSPALAWPSGDVASVPWEELLEQSRGLREARDPLLPAPGGRV